MRISLYDDDGVFAFIDVPDETPMADVESVVLLYKTYSDDYNTEGLTDALNAIGIVTTLSDVDTDNRIYF